MDPLSITTGCMGLISTIGTLSLSINSFVRTCREARSDLDRVARELLSLQTVLELIKDAIDEDRSFPDTLAYHVSGILTNCHSVVLELQGCITKYGNNRLGTRAAWAISGQGDVAKLRSNLEAHKAALELALDMLALHTAKAIRIDTTEIRNDTSAIKDSTAQILEEISQLQARLPNRDDYILQSFLEDMTTYTENALDVASIDWRSSSTRAPSPIIEIEEGPGSAHSSDSGFSTHFAPFNVHKNHSEYQVAEKDGLSVWECITNVETYYTGMEGEWQDICLRRRRRAAVMTKQRPRSPSTVPSECFDAFSLSFYLMMPKDKRSEFDELFADLRTIDEFRVESATTRFTALTFPGHEFASEDILRPSRFQPRRRIRIAFYIPVDAFMRPGEFETQWNFISHTVKALAQQVESPWQNIVVIIEGTPRWIGVDPDIIMLFRELGILFETKQSIDYVGRVSVYPPYDIERDEIFERPILGTIYEHTVQPTTYSRGAHFQHILITAQLQVIAVAPHQQRNDPTRYNLQYYDNWARAVCNVLKPEFIVTLPQSEMAKIPHPGRFLADLWRCDTRFSNSKHEHVNQCVRLTPLEFQTGRVGVKPARPVKSRVETLKQSPPQTEQPTTPVESPIGSSSQPESTPRNTPNSAKSQPELAPRNIVTSVRPEPESTRNTPPITDWNYTYILSGLLILYILLFSTFYTYVLFGLVFTYIVFIFFLV